MTSRARGDPHHEKSGQHPVSTLRAGDCLDTCEIGSASAVHSGERPGRDLLFTQDPIMPQRFAVCGAHRKQSKVQLRSGQSCPERNHRSGKTNPANAAPGNQENLIEMETRNGRVGPGNTPADEIPVPPAACLVGRNRGLRVLASIRPGRECAQCRAGFSRCRADPRPEAPISTVFSAQLDGLYRMANGRSAPNPQFDVTDSCVCACTDRPP